MPQNNPQTTGNIQARVAKLETQLEIIREGVKLALVHLSETLAAQEAKTKAKESITEAKIADIQRRLDKR